MTQRFCLTLDLVNDPEKIALYRKAHSPQQIWPEIVEGIKSVGITLMDIYMLGTRLFMILELPEGIDRDEAMSRLATLPRQQEWEEYVAQFQQCDPSTTSAGKWQMMERIFTLPE